MSGSTNTSSFFAATNNVTDSHCIWTILRSNKNLVSRIIIFDKNGLDLIWELVDCNFEKRNQISSYSGKEGGTAFDSVGYLSGGSWNDLSCR